MARIIQWKRGTTAQNDEYTGKPREITVDTQKRTIRVHDGSKPGGHELLRLADVPAELSDLTNDIGAWESQRYGLQGRPLCALHALHVLPAVRTVP